MFKIVQDTFSRLTDPFQRRREISEIGSKAGLRIVSSSKLIFASLFAYISMMFCSAKNDKSLKFTLSASRLMSRFTGYLCSMTLPPYVRAYMYQAFGYVYGVDFNELPEGTDINEFKCFNQFFTREIDMGKRPVFDKFEEKTLCSPCDGRILSHGLVDSTDCTIDCVKGANYPLEEFLFGFNSDYLTGDESSTPDSRKMIRQIVDSAESRGNQIQYCVIYLSPSDYHRFHSPGYFTANYRRHIAGYLEPVKPDYLQNHRHVLNQNERVNLLGDWAHGFFAMSFIGALNVGSVKLHFDEMLNTNASKPQLPYLDDRNYLMLSNLSDKDDSNKFLHVPQPIDPVHGLVELTNYLNEFDVKDIPTLGNGPDLLFNYKVNDEDKLKHNILNGFDRVESQMSTAESLKEQDESPAKKKFMMSKLEAPKGSTGSAPRLFSISQRGVELQKGEQIGMFEMGSTIALLFECPRDYKLTKGPGDKVQLGESLLAATQGQGDVIKGHLKQA